jgi:hypothetical protein
MAATRDGVASEISAGFLRGAVQEAGLAADLVSGFGAAQPP